VKFLKSKSKKKEQARKGGKRKKVDSEIRRAEKRG